MSGEPRTEAGKRLDLAWPGYRLDRLDWHEAIVAIEREVADTLDSLTAERRALEEALDDAEADAPEKSKRFAVPFQGGFREGARWAINRWRAALSEGGSK